ncbi:MAG: carbon monoxide dehydrogenase subunit G [Minwuiales bacterium]|nr:carbon monoxide dehydrogenase subunit G [Minwuiales bacterium]
MEMTGEQRIAASRETVWQALNDPDVLRQSIPGAETVDKVSDTEFAATVTAKVGPVKAKFKGNVTLSDIDPPNGYTISGQGQGGAAGFGKGEAKVSLAEDGGDTVLSYAVTASVGGKLAQIGSRLIDGVAKKMADDFFTSFNEIVAAGAAPAAAEAAAEEPAPEDVTAAAIAAADKAVEEVRQARGANPWVWVGGLILVVVLVLIYFSR